MARQVATIVEIIKRDGTRQPFDDERILVAIRKAQAAVGRLDDGAARIVTERVVDELSRRRPLDITVENVQDLVEKHLVQRQYPEVAKAYMLHRNLRAEVRRTKHALGVRDDLKLSVNAVKVLERRYLLKDEAGCVVETPRELMRRVARGVALADDIHGEDAAAAEEQFFGMLSGLEFLPNSPTLMNAQTPLGQLAGCFVLPVGDSIVDIFDALKTMALVHQSGGGTGFSFSRLRPKNDIVKSTGGVASGPVSFMSIFDAATSVIKQGGRRRGANMGVLRADHPDILEFIMCKMEGSRLRNFNISVAAPDSFMEAVKNDDSYDLINPRTGRPAGRQSARHVFDMIAMAAWQCGDPGVIFIDEINRRNPTPQAGAIESTNPCGEQPLLPYESCNLGSINLRKMAADGRIDWDKLGETVDKAVHFLDNVIDATRFPLGETEALTKANRKIGLGIMGFAEMLILLGVPYNSDRALQLAEDVMMFINKRSHQASSDIAARRGPFPSFAQSTWQQAGYGAMRNATVTTVAPTGTISIIAGVSSGIEPLFALSFYRNIMEGSRLLEENELFKEAAVRGGFYSGELAAEIARRVSIADMKKIPQDIRRLFVTAFDVPPAWHVRMQAAFQ
ncbi:MAG: adenosylcobalamin-dependent ribonucleoside-diphosphate reductase, partial [Planctomycetes bacterium]|nr:adenosylcobalamin-dependent ribonucleoside-diphosphate reductase [Planctomycetota bacterium]